MAASLNIVFVLLTYLVNYSRNPVIHAGLCLSLFILYGKNIDMYPDKSLQEALFGGAESPPSHYYIDGSTESPPSNYYIGGIRIHIEIYVS